MPFSPLYPSPPKRPEAGERERELLMVRRERRKVISKLKNDECCVSF